MFEQFLNKTPTAIFILFVIVVILAFLTLIIIFVHAYINGREIILWPPKIGSRSAVSKKEVNIVSPIDHQTTNFVKIELKELSSERLTSVNQDGKEMLIDFSPAIKLGQLIGINEEEIINHLSKKIRAHQGAFSVPRYSVLLPFMDHYFGIFSWHDNIIICHSIFSMPEDAVLGMWNLWSNMLFKYNDVYAGFYRIPDTNPTLLDFQRAANWIKNGIEMVEEYIIRYAEFNTINIQLIVQEARKSLERVNGLLKSDVSYLNSGDIISNLEMSFSYFHDCIDKCRPPILLKSVSQ